MEAQDDDNGSVAEEVKSSEETKTTTTEDLTYRDMTKTPPPVSTGKSKRHAKRGKIGKKPADMPRRPLSGYNYFFSEQRCAILEEQAKVKDEKKDIFTTLGKIVAERWKKLGEKDKVKYTELAASDLIRYRKEMEKYNEKIAMRNRKESEKESAESATTSTTKPDQLELSASSARQPNLLQAAPGSMSNAAASYGQYPGALSAQGYPRFAGSGLGYPGGLSVYPHAAQSVDLSRMTLSQHQNLMSRMDPMLGGVDLHAMLGQLPPPPTTASRIHILYPQGGNPGYGQQPSLQLPYHAQLSAGSLLASRGADAALLQSLAGGGTDASALQAHGSPPHQSGAAAGAPNDALMEKIRQQREDESVRQAYARILQRQQAEEEEAIRQLRQRHWPSGSGGDGRYPY